MQEALRLAWLAANRVCAKRLVPFLPELAASLERHGHLSLNDAVRSQVLSVRPATVDRLLRPSRRQAPSPWVSTSQACPLLQHTVPSRALASRPDPASM